MQVYIVLEEPDDKDIQYAAWNRVFPSLQLAQAHVEAARKERAKEDETAPEDIGTLEWKHNTLNTEFWQDNRWSAIDPYFQFDDAIGWAIVEAHLL